MLHSLSLENFRNYQKYSLDFSQAPLILVGPNGVGKTNVIEAIYLLATGRSWRTKRDNEVVQWGQDFAKIIAKAGDDKKTNTIEMVIQRLASQNYPQLKIIKINGLKKRLTDLLGKLPAVLFSPEELHLIDGPPVLRRKFLDIILCQTNKKYTLALLELSKIIRGRNRLLYYIKIGKSQAKELAFWDEKLIVLGSFIICLRQKLIADLNINLAKIYQTISAGQEDLKIKYRPSVEAADFEAAIASQRQREIEAAATLFGPHRDDFSFLLTPGRASNKIIASAKDITAFGSRGEYRSAILALKVAELSFFKGDQNFPEPILLLDDIFSELDKNRRLHLAKIVSGQQTIITTTDLDHIEGGVKEKAKIVELR